MPMTISFSTRRVQVLFLDKGDNNKKDTGVVMWFAVKVISISTVDGDIEAMIE